MYYEKNILKLQKFDIKPIRCFFGCKMNSLSTVYTSEQQVVGIWQKITYFCKVKNHENTQKPHSFD